MTISTQSSRFEGTSFGWVPQYLKDHVVHILFIAFMAAYPAIYWYGVENTQLVAKSFLPRYATMVTLMYLGLFAMSFDFISGYTGYLSFGHAAFYGIGAYFVTLVADGQIPYLAADTPFMVTMMIGALVAVLIALLIGIVSFRLSGVYFAMITLGFAEVLYAMSKMGEEVAGIHPGSPDDGLIWNSQNYGGNPDVGIPYVWETVAFGPFDQFNLIIAGNELFVFGPRLMQYYAIGIFALIGYFMMQRIIHSPFGRVMIAIRENEERAEAIGYNTYYYELGAFMFSAFFGAIAGTLYIAVQKQAVGDATFHFLETGHALLAAIIGGLGTLSGAFFGYMFFLSVEEFLQRGDAGGGLEPLLREFLPESVLSFSINNVSVKNGLNEFISGHGEFYIGLIFVVFVLYFPAGIVGEVRQRIGGTAAKALSPKLLLFPWTIKNAITRRLND